MGKKNSRSSQSSQLNRRWFASMDGWGVAFQVGSGEPQKGKRSLPVSIMQKFVATNVYVSATHSTLYSYNPLSIIAVGTAANQRIGSGIKLKGVSFRFEINSAVTAVSTWRVLLVASTYQFSATNFGSGLGTTNLFFAGGSSNGVHPHVDARVAKVICDTTYELKPRITGQKDSVFRSVDCEVDMPFAFQTGSVYGETANLYLVVTASTPGGATGVTACGDIFGEVVVSWAD